MFGALITLFAGIKATADGFRFCHILRTVHVAAAGMRVVFLAALRGNPNHSATGITGVGLTAETAFSV